MNSRLDTIQAAVLLPKFDAFVKYEFDAVNSIAQEYTKYLKDSPFICPEIQEGFMSSWAQYTIQLPEGIDRSELQNHLRMRDIPSMVYYVKPMHLQGAFSGTDSSISYCPVTEKLCGSVLSLPMHPYMEKVDVKQICEVLMEFINE